MRIGGLKDNNKALEAYEKSIDIDKKYAHPWHNKGVVLFNMGKIYRGEGGNLKNLSVLRKKNKSV